ncbi:MAG: hypothetical protein H0W24_01875 [Lysobacter sp.]|nr:hypothetical protein [Lysobacter sp.]
MIDRLLEAGGPQLLLPILVVLLIATAAKGVLGLDLRKAHRRKEFLDLWDPARARDDLWLEVSVRHLCGRYLPASVIRRVLSWPDCTMSLISLAEVWPMLSFDPDTQEVRWKRARWGSQRALLSERAFMLVGYFVVGTSGFLLGLAAVRSPVFSLNAIAFMIMATALGMLAVACLVRDDSLQTAGKLAPDFIRRLNAAAPSPPRRPQPRRAARVPAAAILE